MICKWISKFVSATSQLSFRIWLVKIYSKLFFKFTFSIKVCLLASPIPGTWRVATQSWDMACGGGVWDMVCGGQSWYMDMACSGPVLGHGVWRTSHGTWRVAAQSWDMACGGPVIRSFTVHYNDLGKLRSCGGAQRPNGPLASVMRCGAAHSITWRVLLLLWCGVGQLTALLGG